MSRQSERQDFLIAMAQEGVPSYVSRLVLRHAVTLHRLAELECSSEADDRDRVACPATWTKRKAGPCLCDQYKGPGQHEDIPRITVQEWRTQQRVAALLSPYAGVKADFQGDPRGAVVRIHVPSGRDESWGGVAVP